MEQLISKEQLISDICDALYGVPLEARQFQESYNINERIESDIFTGISILPRYETGEGFKQLKKLFEEKYHWENYSFKITDDVNLIIQMPNYCEKLIMNLSMMV